MKPPNAFPLQVYLKIIIKIFIDFHFQIPNGSSINFTATPSHDIYSQWIATLFNSFFAVELRLAIQILTKLNHMDASVWKTFLFNKIMSEL